MLSETPLSHSNVFLTSDFAGTSSFSPLLWKLLPISVIWHHILPSYPIKYNVRLQFDWYPSNPFPSPHIHCHALFRQLLSPVWIIVAAWLPAFQICTVSVAKWTPGMFTPSTAAGQDLGPPVSISLLCFSILPFSVDIMEEESGKHWCLIHCLHSSLVEYSKKNFF